ncbi:hypothetical protein GIB67_043019 [Kingdonia uniflora]|uniref:Uncharacterized protein n=1 Tax=Kingdonia uniflora TaxID=39325 RepID=A0A7J7NT45_9MAGN|nr:hypothetical protein GIB67_043019 [Kingdonia uniflora]
MAYIAMKTDQQVYELLKSDMIELKTVVMKLVNDSFKLQEVAFGTSFLISWVALIATGAFGQWIVLIAVLIQLFCVERILAGTYAILGSFTNRSSNNLSILYDSDVFLLK